MISWRSVGWFGWSHYIRRDNHQEISKFGCAARSPRPSSRQADLHSLHHELLIILLVVDQPLWKIWKSVGIIIPNILKNKKCLKPPTTKACCQRWNHQLFVYIRCFFVNILHDMMFFAVHAQTFSSRNTDRLVVGAQKAICFPKYITWSKTICCPCASLF